jgi:hypothetical protein
LEGVIFFANGKQVSDIPVGGNYQTDDGKVFIFAYDTKYTMVFANGVNIDVNGEVAMLNAVIILPASFSGKTRGLLGTWDNDQTNDLKTRAGTVISSTADQQTIYSNFGQTYAVTALTSLFTYPDGQSFSDYNKPNFVPAFVTPTFASETLKSQAMSACATAKSIDACLYDVATTGDLRTAQVAVKSGSVFQNFAAVSNQPPAFTNPPTNMDVRYNQQVVITYVVTDPEGQAITLNAISKPDGGVISGKTFTFTVTSTMYLTKTISQLSVVASDSGGSLSSPAVTNFTLAYSTCDNTANVVTEASLELSAYCLTDTSCGTPCLDVMTRLIALTCIGDIESQLGDLYTNARKHCCAVPNTGITCADNSTN